MARMSKPPDNAGHADLVDDLRTLVAERQVVAVVGSGVSVAVTKKAPTASWSGLLESGIAHCEAVSRPLPAGWGRRKRADLKAALKASDLPELLGVGEQVAGRVGRRRIHPLAARVAGRGRAAGS